ncbi:MAG TPA: hypothetical protein VHT02_07655 [Methylocella sp.]|nr:hypothetical protein [Methylocella sp.]
MIEIDAAGVASIGISTPWPNDSAETSTRASFIRAAAADSMFLVAAGMLFLPRAGSAARFAAVSFCPSACELKFSP